MSTTAKAMEELRVRGNALFSSDPRAAAALYSEALSLHLSNADTLEEFTKSAGNALTCLFQVKEYDACVELARKALRINPLLAKAYAFIGRCALMQKKKMVLSANETPLQFLCRAVYILPAMGTALLPFMQQAIELLAQNQNTLQENIYKNKNDNKSKEDDDLCVSVRPGTCGNGVVADSPLPPLLPLCSICEPFSVAAYTESEETAASLCIRCGRVITEKAVFPCAHCGVAAYCSEYCTTAHNAQHLKFECRPLQRLCAMRSAMQQRRRASFSYGETEKDEKEKEEFFVGLDGDFFTTAMHCVTTMASVQAQRDGHDQFFTLQSHSSEIAQSHSSLVRLVCELFSSSGAAVPEEIIAKTVGVVRCNALELADSSGLAVGQALHVSGIVSFFNHSCVPNCALDGVSEAIVTLRPISPGEELTIAYLPQLYWPTRLRREELGGRFLFTCQCQRCAASVSGDDPFETAREAVRSGADAKESAIFMAAVQKAVAEVRNKHVGDISVNDRDALLKLLADCERRLYPFHYFCHELRNALSFIHAVLGEATHCRQRCLEELLLWEALVTGAHPTKRLKVRNALRCSADAVSETLKNEMADSLGLCLVPLLHNLAQLYAVSEEE